MLDIFNTREVAILIWTSLILALFFSNKQARKGLKPLISVFFSTSLFDIVLYLLIYTEIIIFCLTILGFWNLNFIKDSIYWFLFAGVPLVFSFSKVNREENYIRKVLKTSLAGVVIVEFIINFYCFSLTVELILLPIIAFLAIFQIMIEKDIKHRKVTSLIVNMQIVIGLIIFGIVIYKLSQNYTSLITLSTLKSFLFPIIMTIVTLPFLYLIALYSLYETMFVRMGTRLNKSDKLYLKIRLIQKFHFNRIKLRRFQREIGFKPIMTRVDINNLIKLY
ncbi:MAG: hypothetical protein AAF611_18705 [Bacteroidota bacterium]